MISPLYLIKEMEFMAVLTTFFWSNEDSDFFWNFKLSFTIYKTTEFAKPFWVFDNLLSTLLLHGRVFQFWDTPSLSLVSLTNSQLFGMSILSAIYLPPGIPDTLPLSTVLPSQPIVFGETRLSCLSHWKY